METLTKIGEYADRAADALEPVLRMAVYVLGILAVAGLIVGVVGCAIACLIDCRKR